ncbi:MAG: Rpn family recombination-promoting nuclease/putative transposase [Desulfamplus sp.]|nr:Rpn family recombination-promoting nuclease/putative transposase [Desulfamplus sp.]
MEIRINPLVDCVFKSLLGSDKNRNLLVHFLNAVTGLEGDDTITDVTIMNPYNEEKFLGSKLTIVDIKAMCQNEFRYQIEIQLALHRALENRILYNWSAIYHSALKKGEHYKKLKPVFSIWILDTPLFPDIEAYHLIFRPYDVTNKIELTNHMTIHLLQLAMFNENDKITNEKERWLYFFKQAQNQNIDHLPEPMKTKEMIQAMETLKDFSEDEKRFLLYQSRLDEEFTLNTWKLMLKETKKELKQAQKEKEKAQREKEKAQKEKEKERNDKEKEKKEKEKAQKENAEAQKEKEKALQEKEKYLKILKEKGIDIDSI